MARQGGAGRAEQELLRRLPHDPGAVRTVRAPGRVNLIGEHTDYNEGLVLPVAISLEVWIAAVPNPDPVVELTSLAAGETGAFALDEIRPPSSENRGWIDYAAGVAWALAGQGITLRSIKGVIDADLPVGAGLASSAALELASAWAMIDPGRPSPDPVRVALACVRAENEFVGVRCGIMDQMSSALGRAGRALLIDCRSLEHREVPLPDDVAIVVCDTGSPRRLSGSEYNRRRDECERGVRLLRRHAPEVRSLRDVDEEMLGRWREDLPPTVLARCLHVVRENARVSAFADALQREDVDSLGRMLAGSHASLRDLYEVGSPELDALVEIAAEVDGVIGARMTGAGFGGCTVNLATRESSPRLRAAVEREYPSRTGLTPSVYEVEAVDGAGVDLARYGSA